MGGEVKLLIVGFLWGYYAAWKAFSRACPHSLAAVIVALQL